MWPLNRRQTPQPPPNPIMARHVILGPDGAARALVIVSDMVPKGKPIEIDAHHTGGTLAEVLVAPETYTEMIKDGSLAG